MDYGQRVADLDYVLRNGANRLWTAECPFGEGDCGRGIASCTLPFRIAKVDSQRGFQLYILAADANFAPRILNRRFWNANWPIRIVN